MIVCTSVCQNYIPKAKALAQSLKQHHPGAQFVLCLVEREAHPATNDPAVFDSVLLAGDLGIPHFESFMFKYGIVEASTAVKGHLFKTLLERFPHEEKFVYLDPDIIVTSRFIELIEVLDYEDIVLTPHLTFPEDSFEAILDNEICALKHGVFNLGFLAIKRSPQAQQMIDWWASRLFEFCYADIPNGLFTDQRWMDLAPCFFDVFVLKHPGYNVAPWNISKRHIYENEDGELTVLEERLRFFHFSGFDSGANEDMINKYCPDRNSPIYELRESYLKTLDAFGQKGLGKLPWSFATYSNGERIPDSHRKTFRSRRDFQDYYREPFDAEGDHSLYAYFKMNSPSDYPLGSPAIPGLMSILKKARCAYHSGGMRSVLRKAKKYLKGRLKSA